MEQRLYADPGMPYILRKQGVTKKYADRYVDLTLRALALVEAIEEANAQFEDAALPSIQLDNRAHQSVTKSVTMLMDIALFVSNVREMIDDSALRAKIVDAFLARKFGGDVDPNKRNKRTPEDDERTQLMNTLNYLTKS
jgi:hypothetical protein